MGFPGLVGGLATSSKPEQGVFQRVKEVESITCATPTTLIAHHLAVLAQRHCVAAAYMFRKPGFDHGPSGRVTRPEVTQWMSDRTTFHDSFVPPSLVA
jgi:hypothetical protein